MNNCSSMLIVSKSILKQVVAYTKPINLFLEAERRRETRTESVKRTEVTKHVHVYGTVYESLIVPCMMLTIFV